MTSDLLHTQTLVLMQTHACAHRHMYICTHVLALTHMHEEVLQPEDRNMNLLNVTGITGLSLCDWLTALGVTSSGVHPALSQSRFFLQQKECLCV